MAFAPTFLANFPPLPLQALRPSLQLFTEPSTSLSAKFSAYCLMNILHSLLIPALVPTIIGLKELILAFNTLRWYFDLFSLSSSSKIAGVGFPWLVLELTCVTPTSKNAVTLCDQKPSRIQSRVGTRCG